MNSILALLNAIVSNPLVDEPTKTRAGFLLSRLQGGSAFDRIFGR